jgi:N-glycosylase/DNA lyase
MKLERKTGFPIPDFGFRARGFRRAAQSAAAVVCAVLALAAAGCGYRLSGTGDALPADVQTVFVEPFINKSREIAIHRDVAAALKSEFYRRGRLRVVDRLEEADAILTGVVHTLDSTLVAVNRNDEALIYEMALVLDVSLRRRTPERVLWSAKSARFAERYSTSRGAVVITSSDFKRGTLNPEDVRDFTDIQLTEALARTGKDRLVESFARQIYQQLVEMF